MIGKHAQNILSGFEHEYYAYNFAGEPEKKMLKHGNAADSELLSEVYTYEYDHAGRMKKKFYTLGRNIPFLMASYRYDNLGRLLTKYTGGLELTTYSYNVRNRMTSLSGLRFSESLSYNGQYGGNIAAVEWNINGGEGERYTYTYDNLGRMKQAAYVGFVGGNYSESFTYDKHGNPTLISRYGRIQNGSSYTFGSIDNLTMSAASYHGNRLMDVSESIANRPDYDLMEFKKRSVSSPYAYDANGRLTKDLHKNISSIQYNFLHLPKQMTFGDGKTIAYVHDASGVKHEVKHTNPALNPATSTTNYVSNKIYENGALSMVLTEEGYLRKQGNIYRIFYYLKDHLGSNRIVIESASGGVVQATNYYPFGATFAERPPRDDQSVQRYKYTGKELDREHGLNLYDYGARGYDPILGRFTTMDPLAEKYYSISPYAYCLGNPVRFIDPTGMSPEEEEDEKKRKSIWQQVNESLKNLFSINIDASTTESLRASEEQLNRNVQTLQRTIDGINVYTEGITTVHPLGSTIKSVAKMASGQEMDVSDAAFSTMEIIPGAGIIKGGSKIAKVAKGGLRAISDIGLKDGMKVSSSRALELGEQFLGKGYKELVHGSGRFVSADGTRVFRMGVSDITGAHGGGAHVNFETLIPNPAKPGKMMINQNLHIYIVP